MFIDIKFYDNLYYDFQFITIIKHFKLLNSNAKVI